METARKRQKKRPPKRATETLKLRNLGTLLVLSLAFPVLQNLQSLVQLFILRVFRLRGLVGYR
jgi:hypothetical protein